MLSRGKKKKLIFSLNNRVSQLYSLIDTGIEISKIRFGNDLLELALSRAIALTNSSYGRIKVTNKKGNIDEIHFPPNIIKYGKPKVKFRLIKKFVDVGIEYEFTLCEKESREGIIQFEDTDELLFRRYCQTSTGSHRK
ncbi:MAG: hypothetical protein H6613_12680 [Ignavibacteriales bacterium]|nr:hypothetical protein [Ignavibacteriales bacterium]